MVYKNDFKQGERATRKVECEQKKERQDQVVRDEQETSEPELLFVRGE